MNDLMRAVPVMRSVALIISSLASSVRLQARIASHRERRTAQLYTMSWDLSATRGEEPIPACGDQAPLRGLR